MESIDGNKLEEEFLGLCRKYELPERDGDYWFLLDLFRRRRQGISYTIEEILADFRPLELAKMLRQLYFADKGFCLRVSGKELEYSKDLAVVLKDALQAKLGEVVMKSGDRLIIFKGFGPGGDRGRGIVAILPEGETCSNGPGFDIVELDAIIKKEEEIKKLVDASQGRKSRIEGGPEKSRNPELGKLASWILLCLPKHWQITKKYCFVFDYLVLGGWTDFKGEQWKDECGTMVEKEKYDWIKRMLKSAANLNI